MATYPFLSDDWIDAVRQIRHEHRGDDGAAMQEIRINQVVTDVPFGTGVMEAHLDTTSGRVQMDLGHVEEPDVTIALDYVTAKSIFVDQDPQFVLQAFMAGKLTVQGDMAKLLAVLQAQQQEPMDEVAAEVAAQIKAVTA